MENEIFKALLPMIRPERLQDKLLILSMVILILDNKITALQSPDGVLKAVQL
jgi:hypothetical protein